MTEQDRKAPVAIDLGAYKVRIEGTKVRLEYAPLAETVPIPVETDEGIKIVPMVQELGIERIADQLAALAETDYEREGTLDPRYEEFSPEPPRSESRLRLRMCRGKRERPVIVSQICKGGKR